MLFPSRDPSPGFMNGLSRLTQFTSYHPTVRKEPRWSLGGCVSRSFLSPSLVTPTRYAFGSASLIDWRWEQPRNEGSGHHQSQPWTVFRLLTLTSFPERSEGGTVSPCHDSKEACDRRRDGRA